jgi:outer membrane immunogenic protein
LRRVEVRHLRTRTEGIVVKKTLIAGTALSLILSAAGSSFAADLPSRKGPPPVYVPPPPLWTGFYAGLNAGYSWGASSTVSSSGYRIVNNLQAAAEQDFVTPSALSAAGVANARADGFIGGGQAGYNFQWGGNLVVGAEADFQGAAIRGSGGFVGFVTLPDRLVRASNIVSAVNHQKSTDWFGTVRGRLGYLVTPTLLAYATGGLAYGGVAADTAISQGWGGTGNGRRLSTTGATGNFSDTRVGWTVGGGGEWMFAPNWSVKVEYLYYDLGSAVWNSSPAASFLIVPRFGPLIDAIGVQSQTRFNGHIARAGVNYHFNWGAPTIASY